MRILIEYDDGDVTEYQDPKSFVLLCMTPDNRVVDVVAHAPINHLSLYSHMLQLHVFNVLQDIASLRFDIDEQEE